MAIQMILLSLALSINATKLYAEGRLGKGELRQYCNSVVAGYVRNIKSSSNSSYSNSENFSAGGSYAGFGANVGYGTSNSNSQSASASDQARQNYAASNCGDVLKSYSDVTIAEINADRDTALGRMQLNAYLYGQDTLRAVEELKANSYKYGRDVDSSMNTSNNVSQIMQTELNTRRRPSLQTPDYNAELTRLRKKMKRY